MQSQLENRLAELKKEFETGQSRLRQLEGEQAFVRETLLRISGAIQVLEELTKQQAPVEEAEEAEVAEVAIAAQG